VLGLLGFGSRSNPDLIRLDYRRDPALACVAQLGEIMKKLMLIAVAPLALALLYTAPVIAHPGRTAGDGCHNDRRNGGRHCHGGGHATRARAPQGARGRSAYYRNCSAARAAGAAPVYRGERGYGSHLDRDNDGIGCE